MDQSEIRRLFVQALGVSPDQRLAFLASATPLPELRDAVLDLLACEAGAETFVRRSITEELATPQWIGQRFGAYELRELLGRGGMGAVFKAERTDGELRQVAAIKIAERVWLDPHAVERFRRERQILARLTHPNIARLLDGGTREDGVLYLVMEYVEGQRLDLYCKTRKLQAAERLRVFLPLCHAVEYAHRNLVVHRDLKPSNVLVTGDGEPKLLDFGIAKALDSGDAGGTQTLILTPDFASPEQARGEPLTTAADVYGLGAVLYHLLTGQPPHATEGLTPFDMARAIGEVEATKPTVHCPEVRGDLENILLKALHRDPARRYGSAAALAEDIERYLGRRPVRATADSWWYRARRFAARNRMAVAAGALAMAAIVAGTGTSLYEARRAQQRFGQVRRLAGRFLFDFEESIRRVPGTLEARRMVASTARDYLENLEADARRDAGLKRELADSHYRLGYVERSANQSDAALRDFRHALALWRETKDDCCGSPQARDRYIDALRELALLQRDARDLKAARLAADEALDRARQWVRESPSESLAQRALLRCLLVQGNMGEAEGNMTQARAALAEALARYAKLDPRGQGDDSFAYEQASAANTLAISSLAAHDGPSARDAADRSVAIANRLIAKYPDDASLRNMRVRSTSAGMRALEVMAENDRRLLPQVLQRARSAYELATAETRRDPRDTEMADLAMVMASRWAMQLKEAGRPLEALRLLREEAAGIDRLMKADPHNRRYQYLRENNRMEVGQVLVAAGRRREAEMALAEAERYVDQALAAAPGDSWLNDDRAAILASQAQVAQETGDLERARERCRSALQAALAMIRKDPAISVTALPGLRKLAAKLSVADPTAAGAPERLAAKR